MQAPLTRKATGGKFQTAQSYYNPLLDIQTSQPLTQLGYRNPVPIARRRIQTTGFLDGSKTAMPEYPYNGRVVMDTSPIEYRGY